MLCGVILEEFHACPDAEGKGVLDWVVYILHVLRTS